jgi:hypothetical protein
MEACLFCESQDEGWRLKDGNDFVCSRCTMMLTAQDQEKLLSAYMLAVSKGKDKKAKAIKIFLTEERYDGPETVDRGANPDRQDDDGGRACESVRGDAVDNQRAEVQGRNPIRQD